ncbi:hypothetical protein Tco_1361497 [Tanacetum coccineum]
MESGYVTIVHKRRILHTTDYTPVCMISEEQTQRRLDDQRAERLQKHMIASTHGKIPTILSLYSDCSRYENMGQTDRCRWVGDRMVGIKFRQDAGRRCSVSNGYNAYRMSGIGVQDVSSRIRMGHIGCSRKCDGNVVVARLWEMRLGTMVIRIRCSTARIGDILRGTAQSDQKKNAAYLQTYRSDEIEVNANWHLMAVIAACTTSRVLRLTTAPSMNQTDH